MRTGSTFTDWASATESYLSSVRAAAATDVTFSGADAPDALDAQALAMVLAVLDADLKQGVATGYAPASYKDDAKAVQGAAAMFDACSH